MSTAYSGNYSFTISDLETNSKKRYELAVQKGKPILDKELSEIAFRDLNLLRNFLMNNIGDGAIGTAFKIVESSISNINNFKITGGTANSPAILVVKGYPLVLWGDIEFNQQDATGALTDDDYTKSAIIPIDTPVGARTDEVYIDTYLAEVSSEAGSEYQDASIKDSVLALQTANRFRIVQDIQVAQGGTTPVDGDDANGVYHRYYKLATINRLAGDATITNAMITDNRTVVNSLKSYQDGTAGSIILANGSTIGSDANRISQIFMASSIDYKTNDLVFKNNGSETVRITTGGKIGIGSALPNDFLTVFTSANPFVNLISTGADSTAGVSVKNDARQWIVKVAGDQSDNFVIRDVTAGGDRICVTSAGFVGLGKSNPATQLDMTGAATIGGNLTVNGTTTIINTETTTTDKMEINQDENQEALIINKSATGIGTALKINNAGTGPTIWAGTGAGTNYFLVTSGGLVGIGSTNPQSKLEVYTTTEPALNINRSAASSSNAVATFMNGATELARVSLNGRVGIASAVPAASLDVNGDVRVASRIGIAGDPNASYSLYINGPTLSKRIDINPDFNSFTSSTYSTIASVDNNTGLYPFTAVGNLVIKTRSDGNNRDIVFVTGSNAVRMIISGAGQIGIGATTFTSEGEIVRAHTDTASTILRLDWQDTVSATNSASIRFGRSGWSSTAYVRGQADGTGTINGGLVFGVYPFGDAMSILQNGRVGIGTAAQQLLELYEDPATLEFRKKTAGPTTGNGLGMIHWTAKTPDGNDHTAGAISLNAETTWVNGATYDTYMTFATSFSATTGIERMRITSGGKVGINTTSPSAMFAVRDDVSTVTANLTGTGSIAEIVNSSNTAGTWSLIDIRTKDSTNINEVFGRFGTYNVNTTNGAETADFAIGLVNSGSLGEKFRIKANGFVGIGTANPLSILQANGSQIAVRSGGSSYAEFYANNGTVSLDMGVELAGGSLINGSAAHEAVFNHQGGAYKMHFGTNGTIRMTVAGTGEVGIGLTNPYTKLHIHGNGGLRISDSTSAVTTAAGGTANSYINNYDSGTALYLKPTGASGGDHIAVDTSTGAPVFYVKGNGRVGIGTTNPARNLHVNGETIGFFSGSTENVSLWGQTGLFSIDISGNTVVRVNSSGRVGVGTTNILSNLDSWGTVGAQGAGRFVITGSSGLPTAPVLQVLSDYSSLSLPLFKIVANGRVGIGTTNPDSTFQVENESAGIRVVRTSTRQNTVIDYNSILFAPAGQTSRAQIVSDDGTYLRFNAGSASPIERMRIQANGAVGIGTDNPLSHLHVRTDAAGAGFSPFSTADDLLVESSGDTGITIGCGTNSLATIAFGKSGSTIANRIVCTQSENSLLMISNGSPTCKFRNNGIAVGQTYSDLNSPPSSGAIFEGSVGIGTAIPNNLLELCQTADGAKLELHRRDSIVDGNTIGRILFSGHDDAGTYYDGGASISSIATNTWIPKSRSCDLVLSANGNIRTSSRIGIGSNTPVAFLDFRVSSDFIRCGIIAGTTRFIVKQNGNIGIGSAAPTHLLDMENGGGGYYDASTHQWNNGSTIAIKQDVVTNQIDVLALLDKINVVNYRYKTEAIEDENAPYHIGFIAEETPDLLTGKEKKSMATGDCIGYLLGVVKEQQKQIKELMAKLATIQL